MTLRNEYKQKTPMLREAEERARQLETGSYVADDGDDGGDEAEIAGYGASGRNGGFLVAGEADSAAFASGASSSAIPRFASAPSP